MGLELNFDNRISNAAMCGLIPAVPSGLVYCNVFGGAGSNPARNLAPGGRAGKTYGAPVMSDRYVSVGEINYIDTGIQDRDDITIFLVGGVNGNIGQGKFGYFIGSFVDGIYGTNVLVKSVDNTTDVGNMEAYIGKRGSGGAYVEETGSIDPRTYSPMVVRASGAYGTRVDNPATGAFAERRTPPLDARSVSPKTLLLGRSPLALTGFYGTVNIAWISIWARVLTDAEVAAAYTQARALLADQGLTI